MSRTGKKGDDYYPLRWRVADYFENIIILHRTKAALGIAALATLLVLIGLFVLGWNPFGSDDSVVEPPADTERIEPDEIIDDVVPAGGINPATASRPIADSQQVQLTTPGTVIELGPTVMRLTGGHPNDAAADRSLLIATDLFVDREVFDAQVLSGEFPETEQIVVRLIEPTLFAEGTAELNTAFVSLFDDVASVVFTRVDVAVEVTGHNNDVQLSAERARAIADQLIAVGVDEDIVTISGRGDAEPIGDFDSRIDVVIRAS